MMNRSKGRTLNRSSEEMTHRSCSFLFQDNLGSLDRGEVIGWEGLNLNRQI
jgi:hypothetical protein